LGAASLERLYEIGMSDNSGTAPAKLDIATLVDIGLPACLPQK
jgi:hypothetical protein